MERDVVRKARSHAAVQTQSAGTCDEHLFDCKLSVSLLKQLYWDCTQTWGHGEHVSVAHMFIVEDMRWSFGRFEECRKLIIYEWVHNARICTGGSLESTRVKEFATNLQHIILLIPLSRQTTVGLPTCAACTK